MKIYVAFGENAVMVERSYSYAVSCVEKYFRGRRYIKAFHSKGEAVDAATDHLWDIAPLDRAIPEDLELGKIYFVSKLEKNY